MFNPEIFQTTKVDWFGEYIVGTTFFEVRGFLFKYISSYSNDNRSASQRSDFFGRCPVNEFTVKVEDIELCERAISTVPYGVYIPSA